MIRWTLLVALILSLAAPATAQKNAPAPRPFVLGIVDELQSSVLGERRTLNIYLPTGYADNDTARYPVIYLLDGSADEDFIHVVGLVQYNSFPWIARLPPSIVVGIANVDRKRDFTFPTTVAEDRKRFPTTGHSPAFISFIETELQPFIHARYRTAGPRTIIGESLGGLLATEILFKKPALFDRYLIVSPSLWWDGGSLLNAQPVIQPPTAKPLQVYIGVGKEGLTPSTPPRVMEVDANLLAEKVKSACGKKASVYFDYLPAETHATVAHQAILNALRQLSDSPGEK